jgi:hypothetical protein
MLEADLLVDRPVRFGSVQAYALCTVRNYAMMGIRAGCSEDQVFGVVDGIDRATAARVVSRSSGQAAGRPDSRSSGCPPLAAGRAAPRRCT